MSCESLMAAISPTRVEEKEQVNQMKEGRYLIQTENPYYMF